MFHPLLIEDDGRPAAAIVMLTPETLPAWLDQRQAARAAVASAGFAAKPGQWLGIADAEGAPARYLLGVEGVDAPGLWSLAPLAAAAPAGAYRLEGPLGEAAAIGWLLAHYRFDRYKRAPEPLVERILLAPPGFDRPSAIAMADAYALVRDLVSTPASDMGPAELCAAVRAVAQPYGAVIEEIVGDDLLAANYPAVHAVGRAASRAPRLVSLRWGDEAHPKVTLIGKGVCFDSGGLNIKPTSGMLIMKKDMGGAAHALALAMLVMRHRLPVRLRLIIPAVENAISGNAMRPGDILATRAGLSVEVTNTDAEGRLILADALAAAGEDKPELAIDFATLTGAARVALGTDLPALFTPDDAAASRINTIAGGTSDPLWRLPLWPGYRDLMTSTVADLVNAADSPYAGAITAALFLEHFATEISGTWIHVDVYAWNGSAKPGRPKGGEAMGLRTFWQFLSERFV